MLPAETVTPLPVILNFDLEILALIGDIAVPVFRQSQASLMRLIEKALTCINCDDRFYDWTEIRNSFYRPLNNC